MLESISQLLRNTNVQSLGALCHAFLKSDEHLVVEAVGAEGSHGVEPLFEEVAFANFVGFSGERVDAGFDLFGEIARFIGSHDMESPFEVVCFAAQDQGELAKARPERSGVHLGLARQLRWADAAEQGLSFVGGI